MPICGSATCISVSCPAISTTPVAAVGEVAGDRDGDEHQERRDQRQVRRQAEHERIGVGGQQVGLEEQLHAVGECLEDAERTGDAGAEAVREVGVELALEPDHHHDRDHQRGERHDDLDQDDQPRRADSKLRARAADRRRSWRRLQSNVDHDLGRHR